MHGNIVLALFLQDKVRIHIAQLFGHAEHQMHSLPGPHGTERLLEVGIIAVEQTRQKRSSFLKKAPAGGNATGALCGLKGSYLPMGTGEAYQMSRA